MPWCEECARYLAPSAMNPDGSCPSCGRPIADTAVARERGEDERAPWHFKLMVVALVVYLVWRFADMFL